MLKVIAPVRCPHCRNRLTSKLMPYFVGWIRWCRTCRCTVSYISEHDGWWLTGALRDD